MGTMLVIDIYLIAVKKILINYTEVIPAYAGIQKR